MNSITSILFVELLGGIGDLVIALLSIHAIARSHPQARLTVLTFDPGAELLLSDPLIQRVIVAQRDQPKQSLQQLVRDEKFDLIVSDTNYDGIASVLCGSNAQQVVHNLWRSPPDNEFVRDRFLNILLAEAVITPDSISSLFLDAARTYPTQQIYLTKTEQCVAQQWFGAAYRPVFFLCVDAGMAIKRWSADRFVTVAKALQQRYGGTIVVSAGENSELATQITAAVGSSIRIWQPSSLRNLAAAIAQADVAIAADTGLAQVAAALQVPTITLFGPSWHQRYGQPSPHINLQGFPDCPERVIANFTEQSCWYTHQCPYEWQTCVDDISPEHVLAAVEAVLTPQTPKNSRDKSLDLNGLAGINQSLASSPILTRDRQRATDYAQVRSLRNVLVMRLDNMGDVIMTSPAINALRENLPNAKITLMASPAGAMAAPLLPGVDEVLTWRVLWQDLGQLEFDPSREWQLVETLKAQQFDGAIIFTSFAQSPHPAGLICALAGIPFRLGESKEVDCNTLTHAISVASDEIHQVDRNLRLIESVGFEVSDRRLMLTTPPEIEPIRQRYLVLNPWTSCPSRNYSSERFAMAARRLNELTGWSIVVTGVEKDRDRSHHLLHILGECAIDLIGKTTLSELVFLIKKAQLVLTNNTSTMHIADAMNTPNVVLFAGTELESQWRPRYSPSKLLRRATVCSPCYQFTCPYGLECLDISPEEVVSSALELLRSYKKVSQKTA
jgi:ADP-heptose:LPS heptosyltransferase